MSRTHCCYFRVWRLGGEDLGFRVWGVGFAGQG